METTAECPVLEQETSQTENLDEFFEWEQPEIDFKIPEAGQKRIEELQRKIDKITGRAKKQSETMASPDYKPEKKGGTVVLREVGGNLEYTDKDGKTRQLTKGELLTDGEWGIEYSFDQSAAIETQRGYMLSQAQRQVREKANEILLIQQSNNPQLKKDDPKKYEVYGRILADLKKGKEHFGLIAEKMVRNYLKKLCLDHDLPYEVLEASVIQDVEQKLDFILHRKSHYRGVAIETSDMEKDFGVQFTINSEPSKVWQKKGQVEKARDREQNRDVVEDIALVQMDKRQFGSFYGQWKRDKTPGGPDKLLNDGIKREIFGRVLYKFLKSDEIENYWQAISAKENA